MEKNNRFRPIELVHDFSFIPCSFDQNVPLPSPCERLERLKRLGYGGVALCPSYDDYLSTESVVRICEIIRNARELGLIVWLYDEKFYASGSAGGCVPRENPSLEAKAITMICGEPDACGTICINSPHGYGEALAAYVCALDQDGAPIFDTLQDISDRKNFGGGIVYDCKGERLRAFVFFGKAAFEFCTTSHNTRGVRRYTDTLSKAAVDAFLLKTYGGYGALGNLGDYVEAVFTDEPQLPGLCRQDYRADYLDYVLANQNAVFKVTDLPDPKMTFTPYLPWTVGIEDEFYRMHNYPLLPSLPRLFADESATGNKIRADFWETASLCFEKSFSQNYAVCAKQMGVKYSGHFLYEENFDHHPYMHGDLLAQLGKMDIPGCDMLVATPPRILENAAAVKLAASAAELYGKEDVMIEASNVTKDIYPITPKAYQLATALEIALGATRFLSYYTDFCLPEEEMRTCTDFSARVLSRLTSMNPIRYVYVYIPNRDISEESFPACSVSLKRKPSLRQEKINTFLKEISSKLSRSGVDFNFINDERLQRVPVTNGAILVIPEGATKPKYAARFKKIIQGENADRVRDLLCFEGYTPVPSADSMLVTLHKYSNEREALLLVNAGKDYNGEIKPRLQKPRRTVYVYNPHTDETVPLYDLTCVSVPSGQARILIFE